MPPRDSSRRRSESRFDVDRAGEGGRTMPSSGCDLLRGSELSVVTSPLTAGAGSRPASHRSHGNGEMVG